MTMSLPGKSPSTNGTLRTIGMLFAGMIALTAISGPIYGEASEASSSPLTAGAIDRAIIVPIEDEITDITSESVRRRFKLVREQNVKLVILELNTPGGMVTSTIDICKEIRSLQGQGIKVFAWVNDKAYSGGSIIALAADAILMAPNATIGDSQMIMMTPSGVTALPDELQAKAMSPLLAELRESARRNHHDMTLVLAMVYPELEVYWLENVETGQRRFVNTPEHDALLANKDREGKSEWRHVESAPGMDRVPMVIDGRKELLTLRTTEARAYGLAAATVADQAELSSLLNITGPIERLGTTWLEWVADWLASPMIRGVLFLVMLLGAYAEFKAPGLSMPGIIAIIALALFLGAPYIAGFTVTWEIVCVLLGIILLGVEIFVIPGFGVVGILGLILLGLGLIASFIPTELPAPPDSGSIWTLSPLGIDYLRRGLTALASGTLGSLFGMFLVAKFLHKVPVAGRLIAANPTREQVVVDDPYFGLAQIGHIGRAEGILRPAGKARFGAILVDVVSDGEYIETGTRVEVIEKAGNRVVVRRID